MKHKIISIIVIASFAFAVNSCSSQDNKANSTEQSISEKNSYVCPMHSDVTSDKPGKCPKCGMDLVIVEKTSETATTDKNTEN